MDDDVVALTCALIERPSVTPDDAGCQAHITTRLQRSGFVCEKLPFGRVDNLWATHGDSGRVLVLLGHTDVVPPGDIARWSSDPFTPQIRDGMLYGRGAADMKSGVAAFVIALEQFVAAHPNHPGTVALLLTSDEEGEALDGVRSVAEHFRKKSQKIDWCITGEPSSKKQIGDLLRVGRRGSLSASLTVHGIQSHVAYAEYAWNPIHQALPALTELVTHHWDDGYESFPSTMLQISNITAGTGSTNVVPGTLEVLFNLRYNPIWTANKLQEACTSILQQHRLDYTLHWHHSGAPFYTAEGRLRKTAREVMTKTFGIIPEESTGGGTSDARFIAPLGAECIEIGPVNASIHQIDEHVSVADLRRLPECYLALIEQLLLST